jgi:hypothetical protein
MATKTKTVKKSKPSLVTEKLIAALDAHFEIQSYPANMSFSGSDRRPHGPTVSDLAHIAKHGDHATQVWATNLAKLKNVKYKFVPGRAGSPGYFTLKNAPVISVQPKFPEPTGIVPDWNEELIDSIVGTTALHSILGSRRDSITECLNYGITNTLNKPELPAPILAKDLANSYAVMLWERVEGARAAALDEMMKPSISAEDIEKVLKAASPTVILDYAFAIIKSRIIFPILPPGSPATIQEVAKPPAVAKVIRTKRFLIVGCLNGQAHAIETHPSVKHHIEQKALKLVFREAEKTLVVPPSVEHIFIFNTMVSHRLTDSITKQIRGKAVLTSIAHGVHGIIEQILNEVTR